MSMSKYLWSVARGLQTQVHPDVQTSAAREVLNNSIRVLTAVANALEAKPLDGVNAPGSDGSVSDTDRLRGPAENCAAYRESAVVIQSAAEDLADAASQDRIAAHRATINWEKGAMDAAIGRMDEIEYALPALQDDPRLAISRDALEDYLRQRSGEPDLRIEEFRPILGGRSRQTALLTLSRTAALPHALVVQKGLPGGGSGAAYASEAVQFELLQRLYDAGIRVPRPIFYEEDPTSLGAAFLVTVQVNGKPAQTDYWRPLTAESVALDLAREMALLHQQPLDGLGPKLPQSRERYDLEGWREELEKLAGQWHASAHWPSVTMSALIAWLRANVDCVEDRRSFVHNDMIFHNILAENDRITAVLDWEQTSVGHPGEDLGYAYPVVSSITSWDKFMGAYREAGGPALTQRQIDYFALRGGLRLMNMVLAGGRDAFETGLTDEVLAASAGAHFTQRLLHRIAGMLESVLERS